MEAADLTQTYLQLQGCFLEVNDSHDECQGTSVGLSWKDLGRTELCFEIISSLPFPFSYPFLFLSQCPLHFASFGASAAVLFFPRLAVGLFVSDA